MADSRHILYWDNPTIFLMEGRTADGVELLSVAPDGLGSSLALSPDERWIYFTRNEQENDSYLLSAAQ